MPPVILDKKFTDSNKGLDLPTRRVAEGTFSLKITGLDRDDPPEYKQGDYSRTPNFNRNVFHLTSTPAMPKIKVDCTISGFNPASTPFIWRLQVRYIVGRYEKVNHDDTRPEYKSFVRILDDEWTGEAHSASFTLFSADSNVTYDNQTDRIAGGNCVLTVAAKPDGSTEWLQDYVHLRIVGFNPTEDDVRSHDKLMLQARDPNILYMANAVFAWESGFKQFDPSYRTHESFHGVRFDWPADPANFPSVAFDFGIGLSQFTHWGQETMGICWDWRENLNYGINELLDDLKSSFRQGLSFRSWARRAWGRYNGGDSDGTGAYAQRLAQSTDGLLISVGSIPDSFDVHLQTQPLAVKAMPPPARPWPVDTPSRAAAEAVAQKVDATNKPRRARQKAKPKDRS